MFNKMKESVAIFIFCTVSTVANAQDVCTVVKEAMLDLASQTSPTLVPDDSACTSSPKKLECSWAYEDSIQTARNQYESLEADLKDCLPAHSGVHFENGYRFRSREVKQGGDRWFTRKFSILIEWGNRDLYETGFLSVGTNLAEFKGNSNIQFRVSKVKY
ncbi:MAG: hypothetical protein NXH95_17395 [Pseudomonadaceae bacterium]|nr:hypothetical protein [Pseudomonadaceae bacterium]